jgi:polar amino acid transport system substrate-binding protein
MKTSPAGLLVAVMVSASAVVTSCGLPVDSSGTLPRATGGTLRVGVSADEPWTSPEPAAREGVEEQLLDQFAAGIGAQIQWRTGGEETLMGWLDAGELDVVIGGLTTKSPWTDQAALTRPYVIVPGDDGSPEEHVMAIALGENALLVAVERFLIDQSASVAAELGGTPG